MQLFFIIRILAEFVLKPENSKLQLDFTEEEQNILNYLTHADEITRNLSKFNIGNKLLGNIKKNFDIA
jgi:hypothetical protein